MIEKDDQNKNGEDVYDSSFNSSNNDYGLPEAEYSPIEREQPVEMNENPAFNPSFEEEPAPPQQKSSGWILYTALSLIVLLAAVFVYFFFLEEAEKKEEIVQAPIEDFSQVTEEPAPVEEPVEDNWQPAQPEEIQEGSVSSIASRTGRYYLIIGSFIDGDLAKDYGQKLTKEGISSKIIEPDGTRKFYRLSVNDAETVEDLSADLDSMRAKFGENVWIVKY